MQPEVTLTVRDELGHTRQVMVQSRRFTIGRTPENDLIIENSSLSRRHAVIETFDGVVQITDCSSQNGTEVNGATVVAGAVLQDGDLITLGGVCEITVMLLANGKESYQASVGLPTPGVSGPIQQSGSSRTPPAALAQPIPQDSKGFAAVGGESWLSAPGVPVIAATVAVMVVLAAGGLILYVLRQHSQQRRPADRPRIASETDNRDFEQLPDNTRSMDNGPSPGPNGDSDQKGKGSSATAEQLEKAAAGVMRRISSDDKTYGLSERALQDIGRRVDVCRTSTSLRGNLAAIQRSSSALGALARQEGIEPGLLIYSVLAQIEGGGTAGEPIAVARAIISDLLALRSIFGTNDADSSLIIVAAFKMGRGGKRSHPLLVTIRRLVKRPLTQRNVWYLNDQGGLNAQVYDSVVSFLALGVIAQDPGQFGVAAAPLVF